MTEDDSGRGRLARGRRGPVGGVEFHTVDDPEQARLLTDSVAQEIFRPFLAREMTPTDAAKETGRDLNAVLYRLRQFRSAGLVRVVREMKRSGRPIKVYRSVHDAYFVPYHVTPFASLEERMFEQLLPRLRERVRLTARKLQERGMWGQLLYRDETGETWMESAADPAAPVDWLDPSRGIGMDFMTTVRLTEERARELQAVLLEAFEEYGRGSAAEVAGPADGTKDYEFSVSFLPVDD